jgi:flagellar hook-length control protein FliK
VLAPVAEGAAASTTPADPLQFDALLAAALAGTVQGKADPAAVLDAELALPQADDQAEGGAQSAELAAGTIEPAATLAPLPDSMLSVIVPPLAADADDAARIDMAAADASGDFVDARAAGPGPGALPALATRAEPMPLPSAPAPQLQRAEPARIAAAAMASAAEPAPDLAAASLPVAQLAAAEAGTPAERATLHAPGATDAAASPAPLAGERPDPAARGAGQPVRLEVAAPLGGREFGADLGNRLVWMATHNHQVAELRIDPPQLGPVELRLSIANDQASLSISSPHAAVRDAIQANLPRLQDMLQGLGINLGSVSVGTEAFGQGHFDHPGLAQHPGQPGLAPGARPVPTPVATGGALALPAIGVIDVYA